MNHYWDLVDIMWKHRTPWAWSDLLLYLKHVKDAVKQTHGEIEQEDSFSVICSSICHWKLNHPLWFLEVSQMDICSSNFWRLVYGEGGFTVSNWKVQFPFVWFCCDRIKSFELECNWCVMLIRWLCLKNEIRAFSLEVQLILNIGKLNSSHISKYISTGNSL
jgi:hypothetical protein